MRLDPALTVDAAFATLANRSGAFIPSHCFRKPVTVGLRQRRYWTVPNTGRSRVQGGEFTEELGIVLCNEERFRKWTRLTNGGMPLLPIFRHAFQVTVARQYRWRRLHTPELR